MKNKKANNNKNDKEEENVVKSLKTKCHIWQRLELKEKGIVKKKI